MFYVLLTAFAAAIAIADQLTKVLAQQHLTGTTITLVPGWLQLHYITNDGMALSLFRGGRWMFVVLTAVYLALVIYAVAKKLIHKRFELWCLAAITGRRDRKPDRPRADGARRRHDLHSVVLDVQCRGHLHHLRQQSFWFSIF